MKNSECRLDNGWPECSGTDTPQPKELIPSTVPTKLRAVDLDRCDVGIRILIEEAAEEIERLEYECFQLAAGQCCVKSGGLMADDNGNLYCDMERKLGELFPGNKKHGLGDFVNREVCGQCGARLGLPPGEIDDLAEEVIKRQEIDVVHLKGENNVLASILRDAFEVIKTIEPENTDEEERLFQLRYMIEMAISPYSRRAWKRRQAGLFRNDAASDDVDVVKYCGDKNT